MPATLSLPCPICGSQLEYDMGQVSPTTVRERQPGRHVHVEPKSVTTVCLNGHKWRPENFILQRLPD